MSDFRKSQIRKNPVFSEGASSVSVRNLDLGQTVKNLDSVGVDLDCVGPDLSICEVRIQKKVKTLAGQIFSEGVMQFSGKKSDLGQTSRSLTSIAVDLVKGRPDSHIYCFLGFLVF